MSLAGRWNRHCHQSPTDFVVPDNRQQAAMQNPDLFAQHPPDNKRWFDQLLDPGLVLGRHDHADLETEVAQGGPQVILDSDGLR
jgi:hypothetical protein